VVVIAIIAVLAVAIFLNKGGAPTTGGKLTASLNMPLTGPISLPTKSFQEAALLALDDLKGQSDGQGIALDWHDNTAKPAAAATLAQQQLGTKASLFYIGFSAELEAARPILAELKKPIFAFAFQASVTKSPLTFRNIVSYKNEAPAFVQYAKSRGAKKIASIYHDLPDTNEEFRQLVVPELVKGGLKQEDLPQFAHPLMGADFRSIAEKVKAFGPDLIVISGFQSNLVPLLEALRTTGLVQDGNVIGTFAVIDLLPITSAELLEGVAVAVPTFMLKPSAKAADFQTRFAAKHHRPASFNEFSGYDFVLLLNDLAHRLPPAPTPEQTVEAIRATNLEGVSGNLKFDAEGDIAYQTEVGIFKKGKLTPLAAP
jgi:ABC-type branched-subunit amino acid transport system substrate-binding protein